MAYWSFSSIENQIERAEAGYYHLSSASLVLALSALSSMESSECWRNGLLELDSDEIDDKDAWIASAYKELITPVECIETMGYPFVQLAHLEELGTHGGSISSGWNEAPLTDIESDENDILYDLSGNLFAFNDSGLYRFTITSFHWIASGYRIIALYQDTAPSGYQAQGENIPTNTGIAQFVAELDNTKGYAIHVYSSISTATYGFGIARNVGLYERYMTVRIEQIST